MKKTYETPNLELTSFTTEEITIILPGDNLSGLREKPM